ncbi:hypothetical protein LTR17_024330 [Elasticomyces elasticus]|nr:hypothetical protein LTR17_024330 [Elasticomyces elasticus]
MATSTEPDRKPLALKHALEILGIPTWPWITMAENPPDMLMWEQAVEAKYMQDMPTAKLPAAIFAEDLINTYPKAKVVLVDRDVEKWYQSYSEAVISSVEGAYMPLAEWIDPSFFGRMGHLNDLITNYYLGVKEPRSSRLVCNPKHFAAWRQNAQAMYVAHNEIVKRVTPSDNLLIFRLEDGWITLCEFLCKPVPDIPFPRLNKSAVLQEKMKLYMLEAWRRGMIRRARQIPLLLVLLASAFVSWKLVQYWS